MPYLGLWQGTSEPYFTFTPAWQDRRSGLAVKEDGWSYLVLRVDVPQSIVSFYVDGNASEIPLNGVLPESDEEIILGKGLNGGGANDLHGVIDEVCLYNRFLSDAEIQQNQEASQGLPVPSAGQLSLTWASLRR